MTQPIDGAELANAERMAAKARARLCWEEGNSWAEARRAAGNPPIAVKTLRRWAEREEWTRPDGQKAGDDADAIRALTDRATAETGKKLALHRGAMVDAMVGDVMRLREQLFQPHTVKEVKVVPAGKDMGSDVEIVDVELDEPTPADKQKLAIAMAIMVDKLLLLSGEATARTESSVTHDRSAVTERIRGIRDELAERRKAEELQRGAAAESTETA